MRADQVKVRKFEEKYAMTHSEIAEVLGVSRQTVSNIEKNALNKVRKNFKGNKWVDEFVIAEMTGAQISGR